MTAQNQRNPTWGERLDSLIGIFAPRVALSRQTARTLMRAQAAYDAVPTWRNSADWEPLDGKGEALNYTARNKARAKARHLERNSEVVNSILNAFIRNVVGEGFNLQMRTPNDKWNNLVEDLFASWGQPGNCDVTGRMSLNEILNMVVRRRLVDGGIIAIETYDNDMEIPYQLQLVEVDELEGPGYLEHDGHPIIGGIEVNNYGKPLAYWLKQYTVDTLVMQPPQRFDASRVIYLADRNRPSEVREITPLVKTMGEIHDLEEFFDAVVFKQKITAAMAVWITNPVNAGPVAATSLVGNANAGKGTGGGGKRPSSRIDPGSVTELKPGQDVKSVVPSGQSSELADYNLSLMRRVAAGHGLSYEMVSRDVSQVNYSSARQNLLEDWKVFKQEQKYLIEHFLNLALEKVVKSAILSGKIPGSAVPSGFWNNPNKWLRHEFIGQGLPWIDPYKEAMADKVLLESYQTSLKDLYAKKGKDWEAELQQIELEAKLKAKMTMLMVNEGEQINDNDKETNASAKS